MDLEDLERIAEKATDQFRLETLPQYLVPQEEEGLAAWRRGERTLATPDNSAWLAHIRDTTASTTVTATSSTQSWRTIPSTTSRSAQPPHYTRCPSLSSCSDTSRMIQRRGERPCWRHQVDRQIWLIVGASPPFRLAGTVKLRVMERKKTGRPSKGVRKQVLVRLPVGLAEAAHEYAARHGMTLNDLVGEMLADKTGVPYEPQEALSLSA